MLPRLMIVSSSGSNVGNVSGIAGGDVDRDRRHNSDQNMSYTVKVPKDWEQWTAYAGV